MGPILLLSQATDFAADVLAALGRRGTPVDAVVLYAAGRPASRLWRAARRAKLALRVRSEPRWSAGAREVVVTGALNGPRMTRDLQRLRPGIVVLGRCGLLAPHLLRIPPAGVVNVHPGLLPWIRGNSPLGNSLLRGVPLGSTAFRVDEGIDTGRILLRRLLPVAGGESTGALRDGLYRLWVEMTVELVASAGAGEIPTGHSQEGPFPLCRTLDAPAETAAIDELVRAGTARALFERWSPHCHDGSTLPPDADAFCVPSDGR